MKTLKTLAAAAAILLAGATMTSCDKNRDNEPVNPEAAVMRGTITIDPIYGTPNPNFTAAEMIRAGFSYGDLVDVTIGKDIHVVAPFVTAYTQAGIMGVSCCDYGAKGGKIDMGIANGNFHERVGGNDGDSIVIRMHKKGGYLDNYNLLQGAYNNVPSNYASPEVFANFREVTTTGMGRGKLYRSSNPLNADNNPVRYAYVDSLARLAGIRTEIDLADNNDMIEAQLIKADYASSYCPQLYRDGKVIALKMGADTFCPEFMQKLAEGLRFMIQNEPPYLIHCNEGKDRCGFVTLLLEALAGADAQEIQNDYMVTFENYYKYAAGSPAWELNRQLNVDRMLKLLTYPAMLDDIINADWNLLVSPDTKLHSSAVAFMKQAGLSEQEIFALQQKLQ